MNLCKHFGISLHKLLGGACYLWFSNITLHLNMHDSLPAVVFEATVVIYLILPLEYVHAYGAEHMLLVP